MEQSKHYVHRQTKIFVYWHQRFRCIPQKYVRRLDLRGVIPRKIENEKCMPLCAECKLADTAKINWKVSFSSKRIRKVTDNVPGVGTLCDNLVLHEPGLMQHITGRLIYEKISGLAVFIDHFSNLIYPHLITSASTEEMTNGKFSYKRCAHNHGVKMIHYR